MNPPAHYLRHITVPVGTALDDDQLGHSVVHFLQQCRTPTWITLEGEDNQRQRAVVTLLHGNEPSGVEAIYWLLQQAIVPKVTCHLFVAAVQTALTLPCFSHRHLPQNRDLNRCFNDTPDDIPGLLAAEIWQQLQRLAPEAIVDIHNTSGSGPAFAVAVSASEKHRALASLFCQRMIVTDVRLGALMERTSETMPIVTIEAGGAIDPTSSQVAYEGLKRFICGEQILHYKHQDWELELLTAPCRVTLAPGMSLAVGDEPVNSADITLPVDIEHYNFGLVMPGTPLGWLLGTDTRAIIVRNGQGADLTDHYFINHQGILTPTRPLKLFMITSNVAIAESDCLFYLVADG